MRVARNEDAETWHLLGTRGCGVTPTGETIDAPWAKIRDRVERDSASRCKNCNWPRY